MATRLGLRHAMTPTFLDGVIAAAGIDPAKLVLPLANNHMLDQGVAGPGGDGGSPGRTRHLDGRHGGRWSCAADRVGSANDRIPRLHAMAQRERGQNSPAAWQWRTASQAGRSMPTRPIWSAPCRIGISSFGIFRSLETRALARRLAGDGVGLVGGHAHVVQPVERIGGALVAYGLGDFLGTVLPRTPWPLRIGAMLSVEVSADEDTRGQVSAYRFVPFVRERRIRRERLMLADPSDVKTTDRLNAVPGPSPTCCVIAGEASNLLSSSRDASGTRIQIAGPHSYPPSMRIVANVTALDSASFAAPE